MTTDLAPAPARTRPANRKQQIIEVAAGQFVQLGYHRVSMGTIATQVGITPGALYRHFRGKQELLGTVITDRIGRFLDALDADGNDVDRTLWSLAGLALEHRGLAVLWQREARYLDSSRQDVVRGILRSGAVRLGCRIRRHTELSENAAELLAWATFSVFASPSFYRLRISEHRMRRMLHTMNMAVFQVFRARSGWERPEGHGPEDTRPGIPRASRRERLLNAAIAQFDDRGYQAVTMSDIGAATDIAGPTVYTHFAGKSDLLATAITRAAEGLQLGMSHALRVAQDADEAVRLVLGHYVEFALTHRALLGVLISEVVQLPDELRSRIRLLQHDYLLEWERLLAAAYPDLPGEETRVLLHGVLTVVNDLSRIPHLRLRHDLTTDLVELGVGLFRGVHERRQDFATSEVA